MEAKDKGKPTAITLPKYFQLIFFGLVLGNINKQPGLVIFKISNTQTKQNEIFETIKCIWSINKNDDTYKTEIDEFYL